MNKISTLLLLLSLASPAMSQHVPNSQKTWAWLDFVRPEGANPIISPDTSSVFHCPMRGTAMRWEESDTFNPAAAVINNSIAVMYRAEDNSATGIGQRTSRIGYASSPDGIHFSRHGAPVLYPGGDAQAFNENGGGCEDPRVCMAEDGTYVMMYTQWNRKTARLGVATSRNLVNWQKFGSPFRKAYNGKFEFTFSKSASIVTKLDASGRQVIARINGKYWMYWGEQFINIATSDDLINWTPMVDSNGELRRFVIPREGYFDSQLTECGPPAILTDRGILLMYNGKNLAGKGGDPRYTPNSYCAGQILFDASDPTKVIDRLDEPFFIPEASFEKSGQYPAGTVFIEGLVTLHGKWFLYYGCADSRVSVAVRQSR
jgi:predicted GH43/DUF377 family glycosyl hydrolase